MTPQNIFRIVAAFVLIPLGIYLAAAAILGHTAANADWREPMAGTTIFIQTNGIHTGIVMPVAAQGIDAPTWRQARLSTIATALTGSGATVMHVDHLGAFAADENWRPLRLRPAEYRRLAAFIAATLADGPRVIPGHTARDVFYPATGRYSALRTCNAWPLEALRHAGIRMGKWTPFEADVMRWVPFPETPRQ
jgi:hypothetical protein